MTGRADCYKYSWSVPYYFHRRVSFREFAVWMPIMNAVALLFVTSCFMGMARADSLDSNFDRFYCVEKATSDECSLYGVSIINLISTPERFHGKKVRVIGFLSVGHDENVLYLGERSASHTEAVLISIDDGPMENEADVDRYRQNERRVRRYFNHRRVMLEAEFDMFARNRLYRGMLKAISRLQRW